MKRRAERKNRKIEAAWLGILITITLFMVEPVSNNLVFGDAGDSSNPSYITAQPFVIRYNEFAASHMVTGGDGSAKHPWIIENLEIMGNGSSNCIEITDSTDYFILRNCYLHGSSPGLVLQGVFNAVIYNNTISTNRTNGIVIQGSENNLIYGNTIYGNYYGICLDDFYREIWRSSEECRNNTIEKNQLTSNEYGIYLAYSNEDTIRDNILDNNVHGMDIASNTNSLVVTNNTMLGCGISSVAHYYCTSYNISTSNTVNGKPIYYYKNQNGVTLPQNAGQVILANCSYMSVLNQNLSGGDLGIILLDCNNITLDNITALDNDVGIDLKATSNTMLNEINASNCGQGIVMDYSDSFCNLINCTASNNSNYGFFVSGRHNRIANATVNGNGMSGIVIGGENNILEYSTIFKNEWGILVEGANNKIRFNNVSDQHVGIYMNQWAGENKVYSNEIRNSFFGIVLEHSSNNSIYGNSIMNITGKQGGPPHSLNESNIDIWPSNSYYKAVNVSGVSALDIHIWGHANAPDLDLYIYLDGNGGQPKDGIAQWEEYITSSNSFASDENIILFIPQNGTYLIRVLGFEVLDSPSQFDMSITFLNYTSSGIIATGSDCNNIVNNHIANNTAGIYMTGSSGLNLIHFNNIVGNTLQAYDEGNNYWNRHYQIGGNHWSDYSGTDTFSGPEQDQVGSDGIGDSPYTDISGDAGSQDRYPLMEQTDGIYMDDEAPYSHLIQKTLFYDGWCYASAAARDNYSGVAYLEIWHRFSPDNLTWDDWKLLSNNTYSWIWSFNSNSFDVLRCEGYHEFYSVAIDEENNREVKVPKAEASWAEDLEPPTSKIDNLTAYWYNSPPTINATAHDNISGVATVSLWSRHSADNATWTNWSAIGTDTDSPWSWSLNFSEGDGYYEFDSVAVDNNYWCESLPPSGGSPLEPSLAIGYDISPPTASAGSDAVVLNAGIVTFDGAGSLDNIGIDNYTWNFTDGDEVVFLYGTGPSYRFDCLGIYNITLNVTDLAGNHGTDSLRVTVYDAEGPISIAGIDQTVIMGTRVTFNGSASTDNIGIVNYTWTFTHNSTAVTLFGVSPSFTFWEVGNVTVTLNVFDAAGNSDTDTMVVRVMPPPARTANNVQYIAPIAIFISTAIVIMGLSVSWGKGSK